jgi:hypothetical protein
MRNERFALVGRMLKPVPLAWSLAVSIALLMGAPAAGAQTLQQLPAEAIPPSLGPAPVLPSAPVSTPLRVAEPAAYRAAKQRAERRYRGFEAQHAAAAGSPGPRTATAVSGALNQPGLDATEQFVTPPDTTGAIGPSDYVEMVNSELARYPRATLDPPLETIPENTFVGTADGTCDGQIQWDQEGQRWLYAALDCSAAPGSQKLFFGWSKTPTPTLSTTSWCRFGIPTTHLLEDYPKLGHDNSQILIGTNAFEDEGEEEYVGSHMWVAPKPAPGASTCPGSLTVGRANAAFTPVPANLADSSARGYVTALVNPTHLVLYQLGKNGEGKDAILAETPVTVPEFEPPASVPQPGTPEVIDSSDTRLTQSVATTDPATAEEGIWTQHTVAGPSGGPSVVRWYELSPGKTTPRQMGSVAGAAGTFAFNGAVSPTADGSGAALIYNTGNATHLVNLRAQDRRAASPLGTMGEELELGTSIAADEDFSCQFFVCRWGDYAGASPDPVNSHLVWGTGELTTLPWEFGEPQWGSRNVALDVSAPPPPPPPSSPGPTSAGAPAGTSSSSGTGGSSGSGTPGHKSHRCRKGFRKRRVHGKARCVKVRH